MKEKYNTMHGGSVEVDGDGLCYTCGKNLAQPGKWNCKQCEQKIPKPTLQPGGRYTIEEVQRKLLELAKTAPREETPGQETLFGYSQDDPKIKSIMGERR